MNLKREINGRKNNKPESSKLNSCCIESKRLCGSICDGDAFELFSLNVDEMPESAWETTEAKIKTNIINFNNYLKKLHSWSDELADR